MDIDFLYAKYLQAKSVSTDTRRITPGSVFFALRGPHFDANQFADQALETGASYAVVDDPGVVKGERYLLTDDVLKTLQALAQYHRRKLRIPIIGLTGSNGKTTTKELLNIVLSTRFRTLATRGNLNNHIGVPLTLLSIDSSVELAIIEMGANHVGEIASLCEIANPTHGLITNIGKAHIGTFGGFENIVRGKSELYEHLLINNGVVWVNSLNPILVKLSNRFPQVRSYPQVNDSYHCELIGADPYLKVKAENGDIITTQLVGQYNFENVAAALCVAKTFDVVPELAHQAISNYQPANMRSQIIERGSNTVVMDAYNANPTSMEAAIKNLGAMKGSLKVAILGDMYELEDEALSEHKKVGDLLLESKIDEVLLCGDLMKAAFHNQAGFHYFNSKSELANYLRSRHFDRATILIKASRGMGLESMLENIQ